MIFLLKSDFSIGKSIIQLDRISSAVPNKPDQPDNIVDLLEEYKWPTTYLVEDFCGGFIPCYQKIKAAGSKMAWGFRVSIVEDATKKEKQNSSKVIVFVKSEIGWKAMVKLATYAQVDGFFEEFRIDWKKLQELWNDHWVLAIPHYDGFIHRNLTTKLPTIPDFGPIKPYMLLESNDMFFDDMVREKTLEYAAAFGLKTVEAKSCYYKNRTDLLFYQTRRLMDRKSFGSGNTLAEPNIEFFFSAEFCLESWAENKDIVGTGEADFEKEFDEPLSLFLPGIRLPEFILSDDDREKYNIPIGAKDTEILRIIARYGYKEKLAKGEIDKTRQEQYRARVEFELEILEKTDFDPYILIVWDLINFAVKNNYPTSDGRGSCCGSLLLFLIGVTKVDPIVRELYFERFISYSRAKTNIINGVRWLTNCPDIDCDFSEGGRTAVIEYLSEKYKGRFVKLSTYGTGATKALLKDTGKIIANYSEDDLKAVSDAIPKKFGRVASPEASYEEAPLFKDFCDKNPLAYKAMVKLQGIIKNQGTHASAFLLSHDPLNTFMPIESRYNNKNKAFELSTSCDMTVSESMAVKLDILGLKTVEILDNVIKKVGEDREKIDYESWDDIYVHLQKLETPSNLFQISGDGASAGLNKIRPRSLEHLAAVLAICRPGSFVFIDQYADYINGVGDRPNLHPLFDDILEKTGFVVLYQESLMAMGVKLGLTLSEADDLRKVTSKKRADEIDAWEEKIYKVAKENGHDEEAARAFFAVAKASADYSFNKCLHKNTDIYKDDRIIKLKDVAVGDLVVGFDTKEKKWNLVKVKDIHKNKAVLYEVTLDNGKSIKCSLKHKFLCEDGIMRSLKDIIKNKNAIQICEAIP